MSARQWFTKLFRRKPTLEQRLAEGRRPMTDEERQAQRISFVYGNARISNQHVTREMVEDAARKIDAEKDGDT